jgi:hypothetical protein
MRLIGWYTIFAFFFEVFACPFLPEIMEFENFKVSQKRSQAIKIALPTNGKNVFSLKMVLYLLRNDFNGFPSSFSRKQFPGDLQCL